MKLLDYSWARPGGKAIKKAGYDGVLRYLSYTDGKNLSVSEVKDYHANNLGIGLVWETVAKRPLDGKKAGISDATEAQKQAERLGFKNPTIYFAVDFDTTPAQQTQIDDYLKGCASIIGKQSVGVYGSFYVIERCFANKSAQWFWQTLAWSGKQISKHNHIYQNGKTPKIYGADENDAVDNWGGWYPTPEAPQSVATPPDTSEPNSTTNTPQTAPAQATDATTTLNPTPQTGSYTAEPVWKGTGSAIETTENTAGTIKNTATGNTEPVKKEKTFLSILWEYIKALWK